MTSPARTPALAVAAAVVTLLAAGSAWAQDSGGAGDSGDVSVGPLTLPTSNALVAIRRSEPKSEVAVSVGAAVVETSGPVIGGMPTPGRDGLQRGALELEGSYALSRQWEVFATMNALAVRWLLVGGQEDQAIALGSMTVGATWVPIALPRGVLVGGLFVRFLLPTSQELPGAHAWGAQAGLTLRGVLAPWLAWYGGASFRAGTSWGSFVTPLGVTRSAHGTQTGVSGTLGIAFVPASWLRLVAQCNVNLPFQRVPDQVTPGVAARFVNGPFAAEFGGMIPLLGQTRTVGAVARVSWRLDG